MYIPPSPPLILMFTDQSAALVADCYKRYKTNDVYNLCIEKIEKYVG